MLSLLLTACGTKSEDVVKTTENGGNKINISNEKNIKPIDVKICTCGGMILLENGDLYTFGSPNDMPLGREDKAYQPTKILENIVAIDQGQNMAFAVDGDGNLWGWNAENNKSWDGYLLEPLPKMIASEVKQIAVGDWEDAIAIIKEDNSLWVWGYTEAACKAEDGFVQIMDNVEQVSVSDGRYGVAVKEDKSMWVWGRSVALEFETNTPMFYGENVKYAVCSRSLAYVEQDDIMTIFSIGNNHNFDSITTIHNGQKACFGNENGLYLLENGELYSWGNANEYGQLGIGYDGNYKIHITEAEMILEDIIAFDMTAYTSIAVDDNGNVYVWGQNMNHILGLDNEDTAIITPTKVF